MTGTDVEPAEQHEAAKIDPVTAAEVPSAAWGWSGEAPRAFQISAIVVAIFLLCMLIGNQKGHVEDLYLIGFAAALVAIVVRHLIISRQDR